MPFAFQVCANSYNISATPGRHCPGGPRKFCCHLFEVPVEHNASPTRDCSLGTDLPVYLLIIFNEMQKLEYNLQAAST